MNQELETRTGVQSRRLFTRGTAGIAKPIRPLPPAAAR